MTDNYPHLSPAQEAALDRDGDGKPGGRKRKTVAAPPVQSEEELVARAIEQANKNIAPPKPPEFVTVRVLKKGDGRISMGVHIRGVGDAFYKHGETFETTTENAAELEDRGFVEIQEG